MTNATQNEFANLLHTEAKVSGGRKLAEGTVVKVKWIGRNRYGANVARIVAEGSDVEWIDPKHLTMVKKLPKAEIAALEAERENEANETVIVVGTVGAERGNGVAINITGWKSYWFSKNHTQILGELKDGRKVIEVPMWKVRKDVGSAMVDKLVEDRPAVAKLAKEAGFEI